MAEVSIIVPIYNVEKYLNRCMQSLLNQTLKDIEIIMVDDGSPDNCPKICDEYAAHDSRVKVIHKRNGGLSDARNAGLNAAQGEYVAFVDADDFTSDGAYEVLYSKAKETQADIVYAGFYYQHDDGTIEECFMVDRDCEGEKEMSTFLGNMLYGNKSKKETIWMSVWNGIYRRKTIEDNNIRFRSEREYLSEDILFHTELIPLCNRIICVPIALYHYCYNGNSLTHSSFNPTKIDSNFRLYEELTRIINKYKLSDLHNKVNLFLVNYTRGIIIKRIILSDNAMSKKHLLFDKVCNYPKWNEIIGSLKTIKIPYKEAACLMFIKHKSFILSVIAYRLCYSVLKKNKF